MMLENEKAALGFAPREAAGESSPRQPRSLEEPDARRNSTACRPVAAGDDIARVLGADLLNVLQTEAPDVDAALVGLWLADLARQREARP